MVELGVKKILCSVIVLTSSFLLFGCSSQNWTLMVCKGDTMEDGGCYQMSYELQGYSSQKACMEKGLTLPGISGFECGLNCKQSDYGMKVCKTICNQGGCKN